MGYISLLYFTYLLIYFIISVSCYQMDSSTVNIVHTL